MGFRFAISSRRSALPPLLAWIALASAAAPLALGAQQPPPPPSGGLQGREMGEEVRVVLEGRQRPQVRLAFPAFETSGPTSRETADALRAMEEALRDDLELSRIFEIQGPWALSVLELTGDPRRDREQYRSLGNEILLLGTTSQEGDKIVLEGRLLDLKNGESILGKRYRGELEAARRIAHAFADEIVLFMAGRRGVALTTLAFYSDRTGDRELFLMDYDGENQRRITAHKSISMAPDWSPRGDRVAYLSFFKGPPGIFLVDLASGAKSTVISDDRHNLSPSFAPDGRRLAFARSTGGNTQIFVVDTGGGGLRQLTHTRAIDTNPAWSPKGDLIAFTSSRAGNPNIYLMGADGTGTRRISFEGNYNDGAAWSPDGTRLTYASRQGGVFQIAVTDVVTLETRTLTSGPDNKETPTFSPDGRSIAFAAKSGGRTQIYAMDADGTHLRQLTTEGNNFAPSWSPYPAEKR